MKWIAGVILTAIFIPIAAWGITSIMNHDTRLAIMDEKLRILEEVRIDVKTLLKKVEEIE
jgi:hypothetical protein